MDFPTIMLIASGLAMDSFAVSVSGGATLGALDRRNVLRIALSFGVFQASMAAAGWLAGSELLHLIEDFDHWVALALLSFVGGRMIYGAVRPAGARSEVNLLHTRALLLLSVATSIDAVAVGVSLAFLESSIIIPVIAIGAVTVAASSVGVCAGCRFGCMYRNKAQVVGGLVLIAIGIKIVIEHLA